MRDAIEVFVIESHPIFRCGLVHCLNALPGVQMVSDAPSVEDARASAAFEQADLVLIDNGLPGAPGLLREIAQRDDAHAIVVVTGTNGDVVDAAQAGAIGFLSKDSLTPAVLAGAVQAAASGTSVIAPDLLAALVQPHTNGHVHGPETNGIGRTLTVREQRVLRLLAEGHPTREVAERLSYSERTVKSVLHDAITTLGARTRSQAVARAVRDGLI